MSLVALVTIHCGLAPDRTPEAPRWNVLLVVVDTLRADHTSLYGYDRETSPGLERLVDRAVVFDNALSQAGCTFPSVNSMLTSRYPQEFLSREPRRLGIPEDVPSLADILSGAGYSTAAISASRIVRATPSGRNRFGGYGRSFDDFDESCEGRGATCVRSRTIEAIDRATEPFFVYAHFMEPHAPYSPPRWHERAFTEGRPEKDWVRRGVPLPIKDHLYRNGPGGTWDENDLAHLVDLYDEEILHFDRELGHFLDDLAERGLDDSTLVILTSDHGEAFLEHGQFAHCRDIAYNSVLRTPLLVALPGGEHSGRRSALAQNLDLVPTVLDYLRLPAADHDFHGRSLRPAIESDRPVHRYLFASQGVKRVVTDGEHKLIYDLETERLELYDWRDDIAEQNDLTASAPQVADRLRSTLFLWVESLEGSVGASDSLEDAQEIENELRAVGYL